MSRAAVSGVAEAAGRSGCAGHDVDSQARALLNAELSAAGECRIVIPLSYREDYLGALRAMSRQSNPSPLLRMADRAQRLASLVDWSTVEGATDQLRECNALVPSDEAEAPA